MIGRLVVNMHYLTLETTDRQTRRDFIIFFFILCGEATIVKSDEDNIELYSDNEWDMKTIQQWATNHSVVISEVV
jgi:hypothetical protein